MDGKSKYEVSRSNRRTFVRPILNKNMQEQLLKPSVKHGGLRSFGGGKIADSYTMEETLRKESYHKILQNHAVPFRQHMIKASFNLQQHNDPKHTSKMCQQHLKTKQSDRILNILVWPPQSPDLNPVELEGKFDCIII